MGFPERTEFRRNHTSKCMHLNSHSFTIGSSDHFASNKKASSCLDSCSYKSSKVLPSPKKDSEKRDTEINQRLQLLKESRDYSILFNNDDANNDIKGNGKKGLYKNSNENVSKPHVAMVSSSHLDSNKKYSLSSDSSSLSSTAISSAKKTLLDSRSSERLQFLKQSRDYTFLFNDDPNDEPRNERSHDNPEVRFSKPQKDSLSSTLRGLHVAKKASGKVMISERNQRLEFLKESRDYSFLFKNVANDVEEYTNKKAPLSIGSTTTLKPGIVSNNAFAAKINSTVKSMAINANQNFPLKRLTSARFRKGLLPKLKSSQGCMSPKHPELPLKRHNNDIGLRHTFPSQASASKELIKRRRSRESEEFYLDDAEDVSSLIRKMFRYNPRKYGDFHDDEDDRNMEVGFRKIQMEEKWSARMAREEDARELALIKQEENLERARARKKPKKQIMKDAKKSKKSALISC